jgi:hypothetical protein
MLYIVVLNQPLGIFKISLPCKQKSEKSYHLLRLVAIVVVVDWVVVAVADIDIVSVVDIAVLCIVAAAVAVMVVDFEMEVVVAV